MIQVEQLPLWDVLKKSKKVDDAQRAKVKQLIERAGAILDRVIETFPTYTLHNSTHAVNVVHLMADLLGPKLKDLSPLEAAFLLLSAFYHDIGMVFSEEERNRLTEEPEWKSFLEEKPDAYIAVKKAGEVPLDIAEWYCRWQHADRVYVYLNRLPEDLLKWGQTLILEELGEVCRSHNLDAIELHKLRTDFRGEADLRFCAILLRLADILDFDRTRSPEAVYEYLGLSRRSDPREGASDVEWRKHLCSEGFRFPKKRMDGYPLPFLAGPKEPGVEHDLLIFLDVIEGEIKQCRALLESCADRWRALPLPDHVERSNIKSNGYRYGEYRFSLDQGQVMDLLMGENLYEEPYVFVRELIQNALDTSRHRRFIERAAGNSGFEPKPIEVHHWIDRDGYQWIRFDDHGMGMDEQIVRNHLLKVGSSYYRTASFRAEVLRVREKTQDDFTPISRFGIGLLSCFIVGDRVEISTLRHMPGGEKAQPIRLSLNGLHGFFTLQTPHLPPLPTPSPDKEESGYRTEPGTTICVRLCPTKERSLFEPEALLNKHVACPPVIVEFEGKRIGGDPNVLIDLPWCKQASLTLSRRSLQELGNVLVCDLRQPMHVEILPIDLTKHSPTPELKGQMVFAIFHPSAELLQHVNRIQKHSRFNINLDFSEDSLIIDFDRLSTSRGKRIPIDLKPLLSGDIFHHEVSAVFWDNAMRENLRQLRVGNSWLSHNGVAVPTKSEPRVSRGGSRFMASVGAVALADSLRPDLSVSREELRSLPWRFHSSLGLALYRGLADAGVNLRLQRWEILLPTQYLGKHLFLGDLMKDALLRLDGPWSNLPIFHTQEGLRSLEEIRLSARSNPLKLRTFPQYEEARYLDLCAATLAQLGLDIFANYDESGNVSVVTTGARLQPLTEGQKLFPPLTFLPFRNSTALLYVDDSIVNLNHPFSAWLLDRAPEIGRRYPGLFERIRSELLFGWDSANKQAGINAALDRLRELHPSVRPPKNLILTEEDILELE